MICQKKGNLAVPTNNGLRPRPRLVVSGAVQRSNPRPFGAISTMSDNHPSKKQKHNNDHEHTTTTTSTTSFSSSTTTLSPYVHASTNRAGPTAFLPSTTTTPSLDHTTWTGDFSFVQLADTQFGMGESIVSAVLEGGLKGQMTLVPKLQEYCDAHQCKNYEFLYQRELDHARRTVTIINTLQPRPAFTCVCGDLINAYPTEQEGRLGQKRQVNDFKGEMVVCLYCGLCLHCVWLNCLID